MHRPFLALALLVFGGCLAGPPPPAPGYVLEYYDRNQDGTADVAYYRLPGGADTNWALVDTKFHGHFDLKIQLGVARKESRVSFPVPRNVPIRPGTPPVWIPSDHTME